MSQELCSSSDTSLESKCDPDEAETMDSDGVEVNPTENIGPELSAPNQDIKMYQTLEA